MLAEQRIYHTLKIAVAMCFIGHGAFGIITKEIWCNYFAVFGIGRETAYTLMPIVGISDIILGIVMLIYPARFIPAWLVFWGVITAMLRPLSGEPFGEFVERAGNYGAPFVLLLLAGFPLSIRNIFSPMQVPVNTSEQKLKQVTLALRIIVFLLLAGHGWLNLVEKKSLIDQYSSLGLTNPSKVADFVGVAEIIAAISVLIQPFAPFLLILFAWKMVSEILYPHYAIFEWIERGGSYGCILALWFALRAGRQPRKIPFSPPNLGTSL